MPARDDLQFVDLADFSKGIATDYHSQIDERPQQDGYAQSDATFGCYGLQTGGLAPLPRAHLAGYSHYDKSFIPPYVALPEPPPPEPPIKGGIGNPLPDIPLPTPDTHWAFPTEPAAYYNRIAVLDAHAFSPVTYSPPTSTRVDHSSPPVDIYVVRQWWLVNEDENRADSRWRISGRTIYLNSNGGLGTEFADLSAFDHDNTFNPDYSQWVYGYGSISETRTRHPDPPQGEQFYRTGIPIITFAMGGILNLTPGTDVGGVYTFPDASNNGYINDALKRLPELWDTRFAGIVFGHQSRLCAITRPSGSETIRLLSNHPGGYAQRGQSDILLYWPPNNVYVTNSTTSFLAPAKVPVSRENIGHVLDSLNFPDEVTSEYIGVSSFAPMEENVSGIGAWSSVDANTLLLVKNNGGAVQINGDLDRPTVIRLPGVPSVGGLTNRPANTEQGLIYGTTSGVWLWSGGNTAKNLAPQIHPKFWVPEDPTVIPPEPDLAGRGPGQLVGSFGYRWPYVYAPNNWMMDLRTSSWWRYHATPDQDPENGVTFAFNEVDSTGNLWAFPASHLDGSTIGIPEDGEFLQAKDYLMYQQFELDSATDYWSYESQPIARSRARYLDYRQLILVASGRGRVTVTVKGLNGESNPVVFDVQSSKPSQMQRPIMVRTTDVVVAITARAANPDAEAPTVHRLSLGYKEGQSIPADGTVSDQEPS